MLTYRLAESEDIPLLAELNQHLVEDEAHAKRFTTQELSARWERWLESGYQAVLFEQEGRASAYALYRLDEEGSVQLRQFLVCRHCRRQGVGRERIWPPGRRIVLHVLFHNERGLQFWRAVGFEDHALVLQYNSG